MIFRKTKLEGVFEIDIEANQDERGFFARCWCQREFEEYGLNPGLVQCNISYNARKATLRGIHYQAAPFAETKIVRCTKGSIYDVVLDLRPESPSFRMWVAVTLSAEKRNMVYVPEGCGHGFMSLEDDTEVLYQMSEFYNPLAARGVRWNDPRFGIEWPAQPQVISGRDREYPDFGAAARRCWRD